MDYEKELKKATETIEVLDRSLNNEIAKNRMLKNDLEKLNYEAKRLKRENQQLKNAIIEKFLGVDLVGENK